jgi:hypothetical protein
MTLLVMTFAGALVGAGMLLILRGLSVSATPLAAVVQDLHRVRQHAPARRTRVDAFVEAAAGRALRDRAADLAVCERSSSKFVQDRLTWALIGAMPAMLFLALHTTDVATILPPGLLLIGLPLGGVCGWFYALVDLTSDAKKARRDFRHALASYLELVTILMAGGAGTETALFDAAAIGRGSAFRQMRTALSAAQARREAPWLSLGVLGNRLGVTELQELEASITLAGQGARVRESLMSKAQSMRTKDLSDLESEAQARSETMVLPVALMFAGFMLLIGYPALAGLSGP